MSPTVVVRGSGGAVFEMDVPTSGSALARWDDQIAKGDLVVIDEPKVEPEVEEPAPAQSRAKPTKAKPTDPKE